MPMSDWSYGEAAWHLVHYVLSLSSPDQREGAPLRSLELTAEKTKRLPEVMDGSFWEKIPGAQVGLTPLWWRDDRVENVSVQAVHDRKRLAIRLSWKDIHPNQRVVFQNEFTDGAAIQFSEAEAPPLFTMGTLESPVNIWHWKAVWQQDQDEGETKLVDVFPTMSRNLYAGSPKEAVYMTSRAVGNPVAQAAHHSPVEDVNAGGFGTLTSQPTESQNVDGVARWVDGQWEVVFVRDLKSRQAGDIQLKPGGKVSVALAVWDGDAADRNGQKSVSIWQVLTLEK